MLIKAAGPAEVVLGTLVLSLPLICYALLGFGVQYMLYEGPSFEVALLTITMIAVLILTNIALLIGGLLASGLVVWRKHWRVNRWRRQEHLESRYPLTPAERAELKALQGGESVGRIFATPIEAVTLLLLVIYALVISGDTPWLPSEKLELEDEAVVGYVVTESENSLLMLDDKTRLIERVPHDQIEARVICSNSGWVLADLGTRIALWGADYPACDD
jgi:hypothetical protein